MEKKYRPKVPTKPRNLSVIERARNFDGVVAEISEALELRSMKTSKSESDIGKANRIDVSNRDTVQSLDADGAHTGIDYLAIDNESPVVDYSSDDSIYFGTDELGEHIYDDISEASNGVTNTVDEILVAEVYYIDRLNYTIDNYLQSSRLMGDPSMKAVYGNIEQIKQFHEETFYPDLKRCNKDIVRIAECFSSHILSGNFYIYVLYAMNINRSNEEINKPHFKSFIEERQKQICDKLGLSSYLQEPFQRPFKYQNLIEKLIEQMKKDEPRDDLSFMKIAATSKALHYVKKMLKTANKSMAMTDIVDSKINLMNQGNFLTQDEFNIFDHNHKRKYKGNIFVFERCVVCTERISLKKLQFKAYFPNGSSHTECINENKFLLYERNNYKIEISGEAKIIQQMIKQIRQVLGSNRSTRDSTTSNVSYLQHAATKGAIQQITNGLNRSMDGFKKSASSDSLNYLSDKEVDTVSVENRNSTSSGESGGLGGSGGSQSDEYMEKQQQFSLMIKNFDKFYEQMANKTPTSTVVRHVEVSPLPSTVKSTSVQIIQEMLTNETEYVRQLTVGIQTYLHPNQVNTTEAVKGTIAKLFGNIQQIRDFHENTFHANLSECKNDVTRIANLFIKFTQEGLFSNYLLYAMNHSSTQSMCSMRPYREYFISCHQHADDTQGAEYYLFLPLQHLNKYLVFMDRIINTLNINIDNEMAVIAACSKAVKNVERVIKDMQNAWTSSNVPVRKKPMRTLSTFVQSIRKH